MEESTRSRYEKHPIQYYARQLRPLLPREAFRPLPSRLLWLPLHVGIILALAIFVVKGSPPWTVKILCAVIMGHSWACLGFLAHETMHQSVVRNRTVKKLVGTLGFGIYFLSPTLWVAWHNQAHHGNTGKPVADPDGFGTLGFWQKNSVVRWLEKFTPGSGCKRSAAFLPLWFSVHSFLVLVFHSQRNGYYARISRRVVYAESLAMVLFWVGVLAMIGPSNFVFVYLIPVLCSNALLMSYIATNHFLNPLTQTNDPLANSLSVTGPRWLEKLHLEFGYHVEHHIFPTMSGRYAPAVRDALMLRFGHRYLSMPHARALRLLYTRPKIHFGHDSLVNPRSMELFRVLSPGDLSMSSVEGV